MSKIVQPPKSVSALSATEAALSPIPAIGTAGLRQGPDSVAPLTTDGESRVSSAEAETPATLTLGGPDTPPTVAGELVDVNRAARPPPVADGILAYSTLPGTNELVPFSAGQLRQVRDYTAGP